MTKSKRERIEILKCNHFICELLLRNILILKVGGGRRRAKVAFNPSPSPGKIQELTSHPPLQPTLWSKSSLRYQRREESFIGAAVFLRDPPPVNVISPVHHQLSVTSLGAIISNKNRCARAHATAVRRVVRVNYQRHCVRVWVCCCYCFDRCPCVNQALSWDCYVWDNGLSK